MTPGDRNGVALLVTTSIEDSWGTTEPLLFLGEWCKLYDRRHVWSARVHQTVPFHWDDREKLARDYDDLQDLHHRILTALASALNAFHGVNHSRRYWQILADPWLLSYVGATFDRWEALRLAFEAHGRLETCALQPASPMAPPFSYLEFLEDVQSDAWNHALCLRMIAHEHRALATIRPVNAPAAREAAVNAPRRRRLAGRLVARVDAITARVWKRPRVVLLNALFGARERARLYLALGQVPRWSELDLAPNDGADHADAAPAMETGRSRVAVEFAPRTPFEAFLRASIVSDIPTCLVEHYAVMRQRAEAVDLHPRLIATAGSHWTDAHAKAWIAECTRAGAVFAIVEHGGALATRKALFDFEEDIADVKCTWFMPVHEKHVQLPPSRLIGRFGTRAAGGESGASWCAFIGGEQTRWVIRSHFYPMAAQCLVSFEMSLRLFEQLAPDVQSAVMVKPYPVSYWSTAERYADAIGPARVVRGQSIDQVFARSRLIVCTYPETTFSGAMASGVPTVMLYPEELNELHPAALPLLDALRAARIVFHDPQAAAAHINAVWGHPRAWWESPDVRAARAMFHEQALRTDVAWLPAWKAFLEARAS